jgi:hypothetical protein
MNKLKSNSNGFSAVELLLVIVTLAVIGVVGYFVARHVDKKTTTPTTSSTSSITTNSYAGWKSATLKYEKLSFEYPANWTLSNVSTAYNSALPASCQKPGYDQATITSPNGETVFLLSGAGCGAGSSMNGETEITTLPVSAFNGSYKYVGLIDEDSSSDNGTPTFACVSNNSKTLSEPYSKNVSSSTSGSNLYDEFCFTPSAANLTSSTAMVHKSVSDIKSDANFATAKLIFESLSY